MGKKKKSTLNNNDITLNSNDETLNSNKVFDEMIAKDVEEMENSEIKSCNHFKKAIRLTRTLKLLSQKSNYSCKNCKSGGSVWICLYCGNIGCGRYVSLHAQQHYETDRAHHCISVAVVDNDLSFWCYRCDDALAPNPSNQLLWECRIKLGKLFKVRDPEIVKNDSESIEILQMKSSALIPGMVNLGNTCFFNSVMQCLFYSKRLNELIDDDSLDSDGSTTVFSAFIKLIRDMRGKNLALERNSFDKEAAAPLNPSDLFQRISRKWKVYAQFRQQDSHELLLRILDLMDMESKVSMPDSPSVIKQAFGGELASLIICDACESVSVSKEEYVVLSLSIPLNSMKESSLDHLTDKIQELTLEKSKRTIELLKKTVMNRSEIEISLEKCLEKFMEVEILDGENRRECDECKKKGNYCLEKDSQSTNTDPESGLYKSFKRYLFFSTPPILVFHLKRFQSVGFFSTRKVDTFVEFGEYLETGPFLMPSENGTVNLRYQIYGVVVHSGSLRGGHYISYIRNSSDQWFYCSDSHTRSVSWDQVRKCQAYLLFYKMIQNTSNASD